MTSVSWCFMLCMTSFRSGRAVRSGRADRTVTRHLLRTGSYEVTPPDPTAPYEQSTAAGPQPTGPLNDTRRVSLCASQTPGQPPEGIFTVLCDTHDEQEH